MSILTRFYILLVLYSLPYFVHAELVIGLGGQTWPFMWKNAEFIQKDNSLSSADIIKWSVSESNLDQIRELGAKWNFVDVWQEQDGPDNFERVGKVIREHERRGLSVVLRLLETPETYDHLEDKPSVEYGYSKKYYMWVKNIAERFGNRVRAVMISNEADHDIGYNRPVYKAFRRIDYSEYRKLLETAAIAIKESGVDVPFMDHGISSYSLCLAIMDDLYNKQGSEAAVIFWKSMEYDLSPGERSSLKLLRLLNSSESRRRIEFVEQSFDFPAVYDYFQLHHYFGPSSLPQVVEWVRGKLAQTNSQKEIIVGEFGYRMPVKKGKTWDGRTRNVADWTRFSEAAQAEALVKSVTLFASLGIREMLYWKIRFHNSKDSTGTLYESSVKADQFKPFKAAIAYEYLVRSLSGRNVLEDNEAPVGLRATRVLNAVSFAGDPAVSILWSRGSKNGASVLLPSEVVSTYDIYGSLIKRAPNNTITIGDSPILVYWKRKEAQASGGQ